jgi:hypothetical protein
MTTSHAEAAKRISFDLERDNFLTTGVAAQRIKRLRIDTCFQKGSLPLLSWVMHLAGAISWRKLQQFQTHEAIGFASENS